MAWNGISDEQTDSPDYSSGELRCFWRIRAQHSAKPAAPILCETLIVMAETHNQVLGKREVRRYSVAEDPMCSESCFTAKIFEEVWRSLEKFEDWSLNTSKCLPRRFQVARSCAKIGADDDHCWVNNFPLFVPMIDKRWTIKFMKFV